MSDSLKPLDNSVFLFHQQKAYSFLLTITEVFRCRQKQLTKKNLAKNCSCTWMVKLLLFPDTGAQCQLLLSFLLCIYCVFSYLDRWTRTILSASFLPDNHPLHPLGWGYYKFSASSVYPAHKMQYIPSTVTKLTNLH